MIEREPPGDVLSDDQIVAELKQKGVVARPPDRRQVPRVVGDRVVGGAAPRARRSGDERRIGATIAAAGPARRGRRDAAPWETLDGRDRRVPAPERMVLGLRSGSKRQLFQDLATMAAASTGLDPAVILAALNQREKLGTTGIGEGIAIPHARVKQLTSMGGSSPAWPRRSSTTRWTTRRST